MSKKSNKIESLSEDSILSSPECSNDIFASSLEKSDYDTSESEENNPVLIPFGIGEENELEFQVNLLKKILVDIGEENIDEILKLHVQLYNEVIQNRKISKWNIINLEFSGTLPYGDKISKIDFQKESIFGIYGNNGSGKSTILDIIQLVLFNKTSRFEEDTHQMVNALTKEYYCKALIKWDGKGYIFEGNGSLDKEKVFSRERNIYSCDLDKSNNIVKDSVNKLHNFDPNDIFGSFDMFNAIHLMDYGIYPSPGLRFGNMTFRQQQNILDLLLTKDSLGQCLKLLHQKKSIDKDLKTNMRKVYDKIYSNKIDYLLPKIVYMVNQIIQPKFDFSIAAYRENNGRIFFTERKCITKKGKTSYFYHDLCGTYWRILSAMLSLCFQNLFYGGKCGSFICNETIADSNGNKIMNSTIQILSKYYGNVVYMSAVDQFIKNLPGTIYTIDSKKKYQSRLTII
jgi:energy-coupling factor transporter ATP-binding protein EcfA2